MAVGLEELLNDSKLLYEAEISGRKRPSIIRSHADTIARIYSLLGDPPKADQFFKIASEACLDYLLQGSNEMNKPKESQGNDYLRCARILWRAEDDRADEFFHKACDAYQIAIRNESPKVQRRCWIRSAYCLIFLGEYEAAKNAVLQSIKVQQEIEANLIDDPSSMLHTVLELISQTAPNSYNKAYLEFEAYINRNNLQESIGNVPDIVDVFEYVRRLAQETDR